ncbi:MAG: phosphoribosyltransferase family protein, partial [Candidatus Peregrinibacteria bacterium]|nr:phosphoribosyltransferase family protein [Candidatus Peregrinibacteria bacterium]
AVSGHQEDQWAVIPVLNRIRYTSQQARLKKNERAENLKGAFEVVGDRGVLNGKVCFLVDDVCTTGSTLDSCAKTLKDAGIKKVYGLVVARSFG